MRKEDARRFGEAIERVGLAVGRKEKPDKIILRLYWVALKAHSIDVVEEVADKLIATETTLYTLPPPGRWAELARSIYALTPPRTGPLGRRECPACEGSGFRATGDGTRSVTPCECRQGALPPAVTPALLMVPSPASMPASMDDEMPPVPGEHELQKRRREWGNRIFYCHCCGEPYRQRLGWRCCAAPSTEGKTRWTLQWHRHCAGEGKHRCPRHCPHPPEERKTPPLPPSPVSPVPSMPAEGEHVHEWAVRTGLRHPGAPGPNDPEPDEAEPPAHDLGESEWPEDF